MTVPIRSRSGTLLAATAAPPQSKDHDVVVAALAKVLRRREDADRTLAASAAIPGRLGEIFALEDRRTAWLAAMIRADVPIGERLAAARALAVAPPRSSAAPAAPSEVTTASGNHRRKSS